MAVGVQAVGVEEGDGDVVGVEEASRWGRAPARSRRRGLQAATGDGVGRGAREKGIGLLPIRIHSEGVRESEWGVG